MPGRGNNDRRFPGKIKPRNTDPVYLEVNKKKMLRSVQCSETTY